MKVWRMWQRFSWLPVLAISCGGPAGGGPARSGVLLPAAAVRREPSSVVQAPRLLAPLTGFGVSSYRPTFRVERARGSEATEIEVCRDRECQHPVAKFSGGGGRIRSNVVLPEGRLFYRARALRAGKREGPPSPTFQFAVRRGAPDVDSAFVCFNDANGDGRDDELMFGSKENVVFRVPDSEGAATYARVGDVDGDGFSDVLASSSCAGESDCASSPVWLFAGGSHGFSKKQELARPAAEPADAGSAREFVDAGDVDGDGYADVIEFFPSGGSYFYGGGPAGLEPPRSLGERQGTVATLGGDINGDGFSDIAIVRDSGAPPYQVRLYLGGPGGPRSDSTLLLRAPDDAARFGSAIDARGDVNADGYSDVVVGAAAAPYAAVASSPRGAPGQAYVFYGGPAPSPAVAAVLRGTDVDGAYFGLGLAVGDLDGNGAAEVVGIAPCVLRGERGRCERGQAFIFRGSPAGIAQVPSGMLADPSTPSTQVVQIRDVEGDGFDDMSYAGSFYPGSPNGGLAGAAGP